MNKRLQRAEELLMVASTYAGDGAVVTAILRANEALTLLDAEKRARIRSGLPTLEHFLHPAGKRKRRMEDLCERKGFVSSW